MPTVICIKSLIYMNNNILKIQFPYSLGQICENAHIKSVFYINGVRQGQSVFPLSFNISKYEI